MLTVYFIAITALFFFFIATLPYQYRKRIKINKKENKLWFLYGLSMFIVDRIPKRFLNHNSAVTKYIQELYVKEDIKKEKYLYLVKKVSISFSVIIVALLLGLAISLTEKNEGGEIIHELKRDGQKESSYSFIAEKQNGEKESVNISLKEKEMSDKEIIEFLESKEDKLIHELLADNENVNQIRYPVKLISTLENEDIYISWQISNQNIINYDGELGNNISKSGELVSLTATMSLKKVSIDYTFDVYVYPKESKESIQSILQKYVDENGEGKDSVLLPDQIEGEKIIYYLESPATGQWLLPVGVILSILLFFLNDKDLKNQIKERNEQMERDYPEIVSQILLYYEAGLSLKSTIERIINRYESDKKENTDYYRFVYEELEIALTKMKSGISEIAAMNQFGSRCGLQGYIKLSGIIEQNLRRGTNELSYALKAELSNAMTERKNKALKKGSEISAKLLGPMVLMLIIAMVIIMVPALMSMNFN